MDKYLQSEIMDIIEELNNKETKCHICGEKKETRHIDINVFGPNGINVCEDCELKIMEFILNLSIPEKQKEDEKHTFGSEHFLREHFNLKEWNSLEEVEENNLPVLKIIRLDQDIK